MSEPATSIADAQEPRAAHWIERAEAALGGHDDPNIEVLAGAPPPLLDATGRRALLSPLLAGFLWSAAVFVEQLRGPLDSLSLLLRLLALAITLRSALLALTWLRRARIYAQHRRYALAISDEGLLLRTPRTDVALVRDDIVEICAQTVLARGREGSGWADVYIVTKPQSGRTFACLPPVFSRNSELLAEQLGQWRGDVSVAPDSEPASTTEIDRKRGFPRRGPIATVLLGLVLLESYLRLPEAARSYATGWVAAVVVTCTVLIPAAWLLAERVRLGPGRAPLLSISASHVSLATRRGARRMTWSQATKIEVRIRGSWSLMQGAHDVRALSVGAFDASAVQFGEEQLALPIDVARALCDAYRNGTIR